jgi:glutathione S-transferase
MKLYYSPGACSMSPHIVLHESGLPFEIVKVDLSSHKTADGQDFYAINPKGAVPALQLDSGEMLTEGSAIVQYVSDHSGNTVVPAAGTMARYRQIEWLNYVASELHKSMGSLFNKEMATKAGDTIRANVGKKLAFLDQLLGRQDYLTGATFSAADAYAFTVLGWGTHVGVDVSQYPNVAKYLGRIAARPSVQAALKAEGLA